MSGGGGSGSSSDDWRAPTGGGGGGENDKCAIVELTALNSPVAAVVSAISAMDILHIELETTPRKRVVAKTAAGLVAGAITSPKLIDIIACLESGYSYEAEVKSVVGGRVDIEIRPA